MNLKITEFRLHVFSVHQLHISMMLTYEHHYQDFDIRKIDSGF